MGNQNFDTIAFKRVNANTHALTWKKDGQVVFTGKVVLSKNGRMMTETVTWTNAKGQKVSSMGVSKSSRHSPHFCLLAAPGWSWLAGRTTRRSAEHLRFRREHASRLL
jgi:hypothetical protein